LTLKYSSLSESGLRSLPIKLRARFLELVRDDDRDDMEENDAARDPKSRRVRHFPF
jgi:hypothetical protein